MAESKSQADPGYFLRDLWAEQQPLLFPVERFGQAVVKQLHDAFFCGALAALEAAQHAARQAPVVRDELLQKWKGECWQAAKDAEAISSH